MIVPPNKKTASRSYGGQTEAERVLERRERFIAAGIELFGTVGLRKATVTMLCKTAGLTERYFYESFEDTESLFCAVYNKQTAALRDYFVAYLPQLPTDLNERIKAALGQYFTFMKDERVVRILYVESMAGSPRVSAEHHTNNRLYADVAAHLIMLDNPELEITHEQAAALGMAINGASATLAVQWMLGGYAIAQETLVQACSLIVAGAMSELRNLPRKTV